MNSINNVNSIIPKVFDNTPKREQMRRFGSGFYYFEGNDSEGEYFQVYKESLIEKQMKKFAEIRFDTRINEYKISFNEWNSFNTTANFFREVPEIMNRIKRLR